MKSKQTKGITLIALVITIIILLILAGVSIKLVVGDTGIITKSEEAKEENLKQTAKEVMNLKITSIQIANYTENKTLPNLQFLADKLVEDSDMEYVLTQSKTHASLNRIDTTNLSSIYTKLKEYPYEFEINDSLQLASIDGIKVADNNKDEIVTLTKNQYDSVINRLTALENNSNNTTTNENYLTEEQVVGKWIDGKNIYRKCFDLGVDTYFLETLNKWTTIYKTNIINSDKLIDHKFISDEGVIRDIGDNLLKLDENGNLQIWCYEKKEYSVVRYIVLEYTKNTE